MSFFSFLRSARYAPAGRASVAKRSRPQLEALEDRNLPSAPSFVSALYYDVLARPATTAELQAGVAQLNSGVSQQQLALNLLTTPEYATDLITADYQRILGRAPDAGALAAWTPFFVGNGDPYLLEASIFDSSEFYNLAGGNTTDWLTGVYQVALNRGVDSFGLSGWTGALQAGSSRFTVAEGIVYSGEGLNDVVTQDYREFLGRAADAGGLPGWVNGFQLGLNNTQIASYFLGSDEFYQGVSAGTIPVNVIGSSPSPTTPTSTSLPWVPSAPPGQWTPNPTSPVPTSPTPPASPPDPTSGTITVTGISPDAGVSSSDGITDSADLSVLGKGSANKSFNIYIDGAKDAAGKTDANGTFSVALSHALSEGSHVLSASSQSGAPATGSGYSIYVDLTPPTATLTAPDFTETTRPTVSVAASDNRALASTFYIDVDLAHDGSFTDPGDAGYATGTFQGGQGQVTLPALKEGIYQIQARVYDTAGNETDSGATMQVDPNAGVLGSHWLKDLYWYNQKQMGNPVPDPQLQLNPKIFIYDSKGRVLVQVRSTLTKYMGALQNELEQNLGMTVLLQEAKQNMLIGYMPINQIMKLTQQAHFSAATAVLKPRTSTGSVDTEGDAVIGADTFRATTGIDGTGETVGVISDSVDEFQGGLADSIKTGDLPNNVNVLEDDLAGGGTDEGRAMLEIVHDIAPGASLAFHSGFNGAQDFAQGILDLAQLAGSNVIVDDIGYADSPMFNDGVIAQAAQTVHDAGVFYASAAGNTANQAWSGAWNPVTATVGSVTDTFENFGTAATPNVIQKFTMQPNGEIVVSFQWDAAYLEGGSPLPNFQVPNDLAVLITDGTTSNVVQTFDDNNKNTDEAFEFVVFANPNNSVSTFGFAFEMHNAGTDPNPTTLRWVNFAGDDPMAEGEGGATSFGQPVALGAVAVGAVPWFNPDTPESFTAQGGPVQINFDSDGNRIPPQIRATLPEVAAPDGVSTSFFGDPYDPTGQAHAFFGTSAAAPHVAGAAALLLQQTGGEAGPDDILLHLANTAIDVPPPGFDNLTGFGRIVVTPFVISTTGDRFELNDTSDTATNMGVLASGQTTLKDLTILDHADGLPDYDWYRWSAGSTGTVTVQVMTFSKLELHLFTVDSTNTLIEIGSTSTRQGGFLTLTTAVTAGEPILVEVKGLETSLGVWGKGSYDLIMNLA